MGGMQNKKKNRIEKSLVFNEISLEYKATKFVKHYMERGESQVSLTEGLKKQNWSNFYL